MFGTNGYSIGMALLYLFFWVRLQIVFESTSMRLSKSIKIIFGIFLLVQVITAIISTYYFMSGWNQTVREIALNAWTVCAWTNIFASSLVLVVFTKQILSVIIYNERQKGIEIMAVNTHSVSASGTRMTTNESNHSIDLNITEQTTEGTGNTITNQHRYKILKLIIRCMICAMVALLSTILIAIFSTLQTMIPHWHSDLAMRGAHIAVRVIDETINLVCLCLQFPFGKRLYGILFGIIDSFVTKRVIDGINVKTQS